MVQIHPDPPDFLGQFIRKFFGHNFIGAIAQLGERLPCTQEVVGSIPSGSTKKRAKRQNYLKARLPTDGGPSSLTIWIKSNRRIGKFLALPMYFVHMHSCSNNHSLRVWLIQNTSGYMVK